MKKPEHIKEYKGYKGTWAANIRMFDQKKRVHTKMSTESPTIGPEGSDSITDGEIGIVDTAVKDFNRGIKESKNIKPLRKMHINK